MSPQEMIDVIQAFKDGKQIESQIKNNNNPEFWICANKPVWDFYLQNYRIKPKTPKTMHQYLVYNTKDNKYICTSALYSSMEDAIEDYKSSYWTINKRLDHTQITITE